MNVAVLRIKPPSKGNGESGIADETEVQVCAQCHEPLDGRSTKSQ
jgi:hypothetical protein